MLILWPAGAVHASPAVDGCAGTGPGDEEEMKNGTLVAAAVDRAAREGMTVVPLCPFARGWLQRYPGTAAKATIDWGQGQAISRISSACCASA